MSDWRETTVAELASPSPHALATGPFGSAISSRHFVDEGVPVLRGSNLSLDVGVRLRDEGLAFLTPDLAGTFQRSVARRGDLVFTCWGTVGQVGLVDDRARYSEYVVSNKQMKLTPDPQQVDSHFLYYRLSSPDMIQAVRGQAIGAAVPGFNLGQLRELALTVPPLETQRDIADVLCALDDLIENNRRRAQVLEEMARAIYREWFVHFRYPGHDNATLVDSPIGPIPEGWDVRSVAELSEVVTRGIAPRYAENGHWLVLNQKCIRDGRVSLEKARRQERPVSQAKTVQLGDVLINSTGVGTLGRSAFRLEGHPALTVDSHVTIARPAEHGLNPWYGMNLVSRQSEFEALGTGSTGQTELSRTDIGALQAAVPPPSLRASFGEIAWPVLAAVPSLLEGNRCLAATRDLLLPKLVTGQIDVSSLHLDALVEGSVA